MIDYSRNVTSKPRIPKTYDISMKPVIRPVHNVSIYARPELQTKFNIGIQNNGLPIKV